ncbi:MAG: pyridoxamine 5'-phosphate oxidase family protein [Candidatus Peregrinibacteria bacterium]|nr:pyridoxamine 5'-phosphate oxidase family protein [Candidatus Peregrinibacteria bacterium]
MSEENKIKALKFLQEHERAVISTISDGGELESAFVFYFADDAFNLYFMTKRQTRKCTNVQANGKISFVVVDEPNMRTLQGTGEASEVVDSESNQEIFSKLIRVIARNVKDWPPPISKLGESDAVFIRIKPHWLRMADFSNTGDPTDNENCFEQII